MYFVLQCFEQTDRSRALLNYKPDVPFRSWWSGAKFRTDPGAPPFLRDPQPPIRATIEAGYSDGTLLEFYDNPVPLMTERLHAALLAAGVSNLDTYPAVIVDPAADKTYGGYVAFNLVGKIKAADLGKSAFDPSLPWFDSLELDPQATRGMLLFRLAESSNAILIHAKVKAAVEAAGITTLTYIPPAQWAG